MWWILPWLLFLGCLAAVALTHVLWRRRDTGAHPGKQVATQDIQDFR